MDEIVSYHKVGVGSNQQITLFVSRNDSQGFSLRVGICHRGEDEPSGEIVIRDFKAQDVLNIVNVLRNIKEKAGDRYRNRNLPTKDSHIPTSRFHFSRVKGQVIQSYIDENRTACRMCGAMEGITYHHIRHKSFNVGNCPSLRRTKKEISKCICLCRNCHDKVHKEGADPFQMVDGDKMDSLVDGSPIV